MSRRTRNFCLVAITLGVLVAWGNPALAWDVQEQCTNNTGQPAHDLTKIVIGAGGTVTGAINNQLGTPSITTHTPVGGGATVSIIHWGPGGTPVPNGDWVWGCFNAAGAPQLSTAYWSDADGNFIGPAAVEVSVTERQDGDGYRWADVEHTWVGWTGTGFPPGPEDQLGAPRGPITGTDVYFAITDVLRPLEELNEDLYTDPTLTWLPLSDFQLNAAGDTASYNLGMLNSANVVLLRFVASGEGIATPTIHQFQPSEEVPIPTVSEWGLIVMTLLMLTAGTVVLGRRRGPATA